MVGGGGGKGGFITVKKTSQQKYLHADEGEERTVTI